MAAAFSSLQTLLFGSMVVVTLGEAALADQWGQLVSASCSRESFEQRSGDRFTITFIEVDLGDGATETANRLDLLEFREIEDERALKCEIGGRIVEFASQNVASSDGLGQCDAAQDAEFELKIGDTVVWYAISASGRKVDVPPGAYYDSACRGITVFSGSLEVTEQYVRICSFGEFPQTGDSRPSLLLEGNYLGWSQTTTQTCTMLNTDRLVEAVERFGAPLKG
jgi:hypothetical protein